MSYVLIACAIIIPLICWNSSFSFFNIDEFFFSMIKSGRSESESSSLLKINFNPNAVGISNFKEYNLIFTYDRSGDLPRRCCRGRFRSDLFSIFCSDLIVFANFWDISAWSSCVNWSRVLAFFLANSLAKKKFLGIFLAAKIVYYINKF